MKERPQVEFMFGDPQWRIDFVYARSPGFVAVEAVLAIAECFISPVDGGADMKYRGVRTLTTFFRSLN